MSSQRGFPRLACLSFSFGEGHGGWVGKEVSHRADVNPAPRLLANPFPSSFPPSSTLQDVFQMGVARKGRAGGKRNEEMAYNTALVSGASWGLGCWVHHAIMRSYGSCGRRLANDLFPNMHERPTPCRRQTLVLFSLFGLIDEWILGQPHCIYTNMAH